MTPSIESYQNAIVRIYNGNNVKGAGFWVKEGYLITCAHVVRDALGISKSPTEASNAFFFIGKNVEIDFPSIDPGKKLRAEVAFYRWVKETNKFKEDIAVLRLLDPLPENATPVQLSPSYELRDPYYVIGFPKGHEMGIMSRGEIFTRLPNGFVHLESITTEGLAIEGGFSGAPVWNERTSAVVGMVAECVKADDEKPNPKIGFMVPATSILSVLELLSLSNLLQDKADSITKSVRQAYSLCCPKDWAKPTPDSLQDILRALQDMKSGSTGYAAIDRFAALLTFPQLNQDDPVRQQISQWLTNRVPDLQVLLEQVRALIPPDRSGDSPPTTESHLLIYVQEEVEESRAVLALFIDDGERYSSQSIEGWRRVQAPRDFGEKITRQQLPDLVRASLEEVADLFQHLVIHLILPIDWLGQDCDRWFITEQQSPFLPQIPVGADYRFVVRIAERLYPKAIPPSYRHMQKWETKWKDLHRLQPHEVCSSFVLGDSLSNPTQYLAQLSKPNNLGLKHSGLCLDADELLPIFGILIAAGTPAAIWLRQNQFVEDLVPVDELDLLLGCNIATLPEAVRRCRHDAMDVTEDSHIGHHLSFLWDDQNLVPPPATHQIGMPEL